METLLIHPRKMDDERDEVLAALSGKGSGAAFAVLVTRHQSAVWVIASNMCATFRDAEQVLQQSFLSAWTHGLAIPAGATFTTSLYRIAMRIALAQRELVRRSTPCSLDPLLPVFDDAGRLVEGKGRWREFDGTTLEAMEITGLLREALDCTDDRARAAFVLRDVLELPLEEAAAILGTSPEAICRDAHRMRLMLRGFIDRL